MTPEALAEAQPTAGRARRTSTRPNSARLGLFVVAQLAARHGVRVQLRTSPYGGVTAVALVPNDLIVSGELGMPHAPSVRQQPAWSTPVGLAPALVPTTTNSPDLDDTAPIPLDRRIRTISRLSRSGSRAAIAPARDAPPATPVRAVTERRRDPRAASCRRTVQPARGPAGRRRSEPPRLAELLRSPEGLPRRVRQANLAPQLRDPQPRRADRSTSRRPGGRGRRSRYAHDELVPGGTDAAAGTPRRTGPPADATCSAGAGAPIAAERHDRPGRGRIVPADEPDRGPGLAARRPDRAGAVGASRPSCCRPTAC